MDGRTANVVALHDPWSDVERWSLRAQALAELRALGRRDEEPEETDARSQAPRPIVLP